MKSTTKISISSSKHLDDLFTTAPPSDQNDIDDEDLWKLLKHSDLDNLLGEFSSSQSSSYA